MAKLNLYYPLHPCTISQVFGVNEGANYTKIMGFDGHPGQDLVNYQNGVNCSFGMPVRASHDGKVIQVEKDTNGGNTVVLITNEQFDYKGGQSYFKTIYAHLMTGSIKVPAPTYDYTLKQWNYYPIKTGDILGLCGSSGVIPGALMEDPKLAHVHFGLKPAGYITNPDPFENFYKNSEQNNGYGGAIDNQPYWTGLYADDYVITPSLETPANPIQVQEVSLLTRVVELLKKLINL